MPFVTANNAQSTIANVGGIGAGATSMDVAPGDGALFSAASPSVSSPLKVTLVDSLTAPTVYEIIHVTGVSTDTLTIVRGQEGTTARAWAQNDFVSARLTKGFIDNLPQLDKVNTFSAAQVISSLSSSGVTGGDKGAGTINVTSLYEAGTLLTAKYGQLAVANTWTANQLIQDNLYLQIGTGGDLALHHNGADSFLLNSTGILYVRSEVVSGQIILVTKDSSGTYKTGIQIGAATPDVKLYYDSSVVFQTVSSGTIMGDNLISYHGASNDMQQYHDGVDSFLLNNTGTLKLRANNNSGTVTIDGRDSGGNVKTCAQFGGATPLATLYYDGNSRLSASSGGIAVNNNGATTYININRNDTHGSAVTMGGIAFYGKDSGAATETYGLISCYVVDDTATSEDSRLYFQTVVAGASAQRMYIGAGLAVGTPTGGDKGASTINATTLYEGGTALSALYQGYDVDTAKTDVVQGYTAQQYFGEATLTDGANISWNLNTQQEAKVTLAGNRTLDNPTNQQAGSWYHLRVIQDATGSRTLSYGTNYKFGAAGIPTLSTAANAQDVLAFRSNGTLMQYMGIAKGVQA